MSFSTGGIMRKHYHWRRAAASLLIAGMFAGCAAPATPIASPEREATEAITEPPTEIATEAQDVEPTEPPFEATHDIELEGPVMALTYILHNDPFAQGTLRAVESTDSLGDMLVFANTVFDETNTRELGKEYGLCVRTDYRWWYCVRTLKLVNGTLTAHEGVITGGTGDYNRASGQVTVATNANFDSDGLWYTLPMTRKPGELLRFEVIERMETNIIRQVHGDPNSDVVVEIMTFNNPLVDEGGAELGTDQGICVRTIAGEVWHCLRTFILPGGQVMTQGIYADSGNREFAIIGGTGAYSGASGQLTLRDGSDDTSYEVRFELFNWQSAAETEAFKLTDHAGADGAHFGTEGESDVPGDTRVFGGTGEGISESHNGGCFRIIAGESWLCMLSLSMDYTGNIGIMGILYDSVESVLAITGGMGRYGAASGEVTLRESEREENLYNFEYLLIP
jgi:allene oxide cyclase